MSRDCFILSVALVIPLNKWFINPAVCVDTTAECCSVQRMQQACYIDLGFVEKHACLFTITSTCIR